MRRAITPLPLRMIFLFLQAFQSKIINIYYFSKFGVKITQIMKKKWLIDEFGAKCTVNILKMTNNLKLMRQSEKSICSIAYSHPHARRQCVTVYLSYN